jgi:hypothetical protein
MGETMAASLLCLDQSRVHIKGATAGQSKTPICIMMWRINILAICFSISLVQSSTAYQSVQVSKIDTGLLQNDGQYAHENSKTNDNSVRETDDSLSGGLIERWILEWNEEHSLTSKQNTYTGTNVGSENVIC